MLFASFPVELNRRSSHDRMRIVALSMAGILAAPFISAQSGGTASATLRQNGEHQLQEGRTTLDPQTLTAAQSAFVDCIRADPRNFQCAYDTAVSEWYLVKAESIAGDNNASRRWLDAAIAAAQKAIALNAESANAHALLADLYGQKITGAISGMRYGPKANEERARAFQLDPGNALAFAVEGRKCLYAPSMFGGDLDKAIASFKRATELDPRSTKTLCGWRSPTAEKAMRQRNSRPWPKPYV